MHIEPISDAQFVKDKLRSNVFNIKSIIEKTDISRYQIKRLIDGLPVKSYVVITLYSYFKKLGD